LSAPLGRLGAERRFLQRAASEPHLALHRLRRVASPQVAFLDRDRDPRHTLLIAGSARSGSTWLAEIVAEALHGRLIFEPLRRDDATLARTVGFGHYTDPDAGEPDVADALARVLTGRLRSQWSDQYNAVRFPKRRVVKEIRANNLLPWIARHYPQTPIVYLLRHPLPSASSLVDLGWPTRLDQFLAQDHLMQGPLAPFRAIIGDVVADGDPFLEFVLRWCLENIVPITMLARHQAHVVFYEQLVDAPQAEIDRLAGYLRRFGPGAWALTHEPIDAVTRPSHTNYRGTDLTMAGSGHRDHSPDVSPVTVARAREIVAGFGLDRVYGVPTHPLVGPETVLPLTEQPEEAPG
jgi:hypothetical protein